MSEGRKYFFFEKKKQKTFDFGFRQRGQMDGIGAARNRKKFFGSFFQKRTAFLALEVLLMRIGMGRRTHCCRNGVTG